MFSRWGLRLLVVLGFMALVGCSSGGGDGDGDGGEDGTTGTGLVELFGTAAVGKPLADAEVTIRDRAGTKRITKTDTNGKYSIDVKGMVEPYLIRVHDQQARSYYAAAVTHGVANLHPLSDVAARNWFGSRGRNIAQEFDDGNEIKDPPKESELAALSSVLRALLRIAYEQFGMGASFDFDHTPFDADGSKFDGLLDSLNISIEKNKITILLRDSKTGIPAAIIIDFDLSDDLAKPDSTEPSIPAGLATIPASTSGLVVVWNSSQDNIGVAGYNIYRDDVKVATSPYPVFSDTGLAATTRYCYTVEAFDGANNTSAKTAQVCATTPRDPDIAAPSMPQLQTPNAIGAISSALAWIPAPESDTLGYHIYRGASGAEKQKIATTVASGFTDTGLSAVTEYCYQVRAFDAALNLSDPSVETCVTTPANDPPTDTTAPTSLATPVGGTYTSAQFVTLTCNDDVGCAAIYYTVDGNEPSTLSSVYTQPFVISASTTVRFFAVDRTGNVEVASHSEPYVIYTGVSSFTNGSFELGPVIPSPGWVQLPEGSTAITGWTVLGTSIDIIGSGVSASDGTRTVDLDGGNSIGGGIKQSLSTVPGQIYLVTFDLAGNTGGSPVIKQVSVAIDSFVQTYTFDISGQTATTLKWQPNRFSFTASTTNSTLSFTSLTAGFGIYGPLIDHVQVFEEKTNTGG